MADQPDGAYLVIGVIAFLVCLAFLAATKDEREEYTHSTRYYGSRGNHGNQNRPYIGREDAEEVVRRMRRQAYHNNDYGNHFVENASMRRRQRQTEPEEYTYSTRYYGSRNNHDNQKRPYSRWEDAEEVIRRMRRQGLDDAGTLRAYYNHDYGKWFIGNTSM